MENSLIVNLWYMTKLYIGPNLVFWQNLGDKNPNTNTKEANFSPCFLVSTSQEMKFKLFFEVGNIFLLSLFAKFGLFETFLPAGASAYKNQYME